MSRDTFRLPVLQVGEAEDTRPEAVRKEPPTKGVHVGSAPMITHEHTDPVDKPEFIASIPSVVVEPSGAPVSDEVERWRNIPVMDNSGLGELEPGTPAGGGELISVPKAVVATVAEPDSVPVMAVANGGTSELEEGESVRPIHVPEPREGEQIKRRPANG